MANGTAQYVIQKAFQDANKVARGGTPTPLQYLDGLERLNDIVNFEQVKGLKLWLETETTVTLVAGQQMYSFRTGGDVSMDRPLRVKEAAYWDAQSNNRPLVPISREEWTRLSNRTVQGSVNQYFVEKLYDRLNLYLWNIPDTVAATGTVKVVLHNQATNAAVISDTTRFPPEWALFLRYALAEDLAAGMPAETVQRVTGKAAFYRKELEDWDVEDAPTFFQPDQRAFLGSKFE